MFQHSRQIGLASANAILFPSENTLKELGYVIKIGFILAWTKAYRHLGNAASNRAEGQHGAVKYPIAASTGDLADVYQRILLAVDHQDKVIRHSIDYSRAYTLIALSDNIWADFRRKYHITHYRRRMKR